VQKKLAPSRERAKALIMSGKVFVEDRPVDKPGTQVDSAAPVRVKATGHPYVSRGGLKLEAALDCFNIDVSGKVCIDVGASTGGFTDCLLHHKARRVYAVDVGYGQLAWKLRIDDRVVLLERTNIRHITPDAIPKMVDLITIDVSFISLKIVIPAIKRYLTPSGSVLTLIKPQFEVGKGMVGKGGIVKDSVLHTQVINDLSAFFFDQAFQTVGVIPSPIHGAKGNVEFLAHLQQKEK
jgi:23S rRNA (cytidine1920-2'-O)/16S rRNA (cytidine1409-2'-O)-methyltransferase